MFQRCITADFFTFLLRPQLPGSLFSKDGNFRVRKRYFGGLNPNVSTIALEPLGSGTIGLWNHFALEPLPAPEPSPVPWNLGGLLDLVPPDLALGWVGGPAPLGPLDRSIGPWVQKGRHRGGGRNWLC